MGDLAREPVGAYIIAARILVAGAQRFVALARTGSGRDVGAQFAHDVAAPFT
jgi:hypothetical protein